MATFDQKQVLYAPTFHTFQRQDIHFFVDGRRPHWIATDARGADILRLIDGKKTFGDLIQAYAHRHPVDLSTAWLHVHDFLLAALRTGIVATRLDVSPKDPYPGRGHFLKTEHLQEFWVHTNNSCNLVCTHCLVDSHPGANPGIKTGQILSILDQARALGAYRFYFTGGEPFLRKDIFELIDHVTHMPEQPLDVRSRHLSPSTTQQSLPGQSQSHRSIPAQLILLTNATLFEGERRLALDRLDRFRVKMQVSLDGPTAAINDAIRGQGTFAKIIGGIRLLRGMGFDLSLTVVMTKNNVDHLSYFPCLAKELGVPSLHVMWPHHRGRALEDPVSHFPSVERMLDAARRVKDACDACGVTMDNWESLKLRASGLPDMKYDLGNAGWGSLCLYSDGHLYPSAALAGNPRLDMGDAMQRTMKDLWLTSPVAQEIREATLVDQKGIQEDPFRFFIGGGDLEQVYSFSEARRGQGDFVSEDPLYPLYRDMLQDTMESLAIQGRDRANGRSGYNAPVIYHAMGESGFHCGDPLDASPVKTLHSNCVLSFDVEKPYKVVQAFYGKAAETPQPGLCCPTAYAPGEIDHIPEEVLERFYGCGSPVTLAGIRPGETLVDLGSGGGIDCFIAAKKVGPQGKVIGIDMTDRMLAVARRNQGLVAEKLGYDCVEFRKGYLEQIPVEPATVDLITSNCVINLSPDKKAVFSGMWRLLRDHGRIVLSDIVSEIRVPPAIQGDEQLWGECIAGALTEDAFLSILEQTGFYGLEILKKSFYKEVAGYRFHSLTVRGYKYSKTSGCVYLGQKAIYRGPFKSVIDEEGHLFPRYEAVEVCTDTAAKLSADPYRDVFVVIEPDTADHEGSSRDGFDLQRRSSSVDQVTRSESRETCVPSNGNNGGCC